MATAFPHPLFGQAVTGGAASVPTFPPTALQFQPTNERPPSIDPDTPMAVVAGIPRPLRPLNVSKYTFAGYYDDPASYRFQSSSSMIHFPKRRQVGLQEGISGAEGVKAVKVATKPHVSELSFDRRNSSTDITDQVIDLNILPRIPETPPNTTKQPWFGVPHNPHLPTKPTSLPLSVSSTYDESVLGSEDVTDSLEECLDTCTTENTSSDEINIVYEHEQEHEAKAGLGGVSSWWSWLYGYVPSARYGMDMDRRVSGTGTEPTTPCSEPEEEVNDMGTMDIKKVTVNVALPDMEVSAPKKDVECVSADLKFWKEPWEAINLDPPSQLITLEEAKNIASALPYAEQGRDWHLTYATYRDGYSIKSLYRQCREHPQPSVLLIKDADSNIFGGFCTSSFCLTGTYRHEGQGGSFLFTARPQFQSFRWSAKNDYVMMAKPDSLHMGLSDGKYGLWLDESLLFGHSDECETYNNTPLTERRDFKIVQVEVWHLL
eukprot:comp20651_c0_seq1/m.26787 comp20651_c0_seq1/g.26787  ORF comp20651_c0_seq1/g.26787 comp20651_c0_seq1/m.26787 type:complete len:489 (-) comp20651_c0_seq1:115-1581(-)